MISSQPHPSVVSQFAELPMQKMLVAIDVALTDHQMLAAGVLEGSVVLVLDRDRDGIEQITDALHSHTAITSLHLVCHGAPGCLYLGNTCLSLDTLANYTPQLETWFSLQSRLNIAPSLLIYGCNVAAGDAGIEFVERLHQLTGVPVAASATPTGSVEHSGNWQLEVTTGEVEVVLGFQEQLMQEYASIFAAGDLDLSFGNGGRVQTDLTGNASGKGDFARSITLQADGKIVVAGHVGNSTSFGSFGSDFGNIDDFAVARYNSDGSLDTSFGNGGTVITDIAGGNDYGYSVALQPDGKIVMAGFARNPAFFDAPPNFALVRYNSDGSLDSSFGNGGKVLSGTEGYETVFDMILQPDGKIVLLGFISVFPNEGPAIVRYNSDGSLDTSFGNGGRVFLSGSISLAHSVVLQADGKIVVAGAAGGAADDFAVFRYNADGSLDTSFGNGGQTIGLSGMYDYGLVDDFALDMTLQADGKIIATGLIGGYYHMVRYNSDGSLDTSFGNGGRVKIGGSPNEENTGFGIAVQPDGKIVVGDARYNSDGSLDTSFGNGGKVSNNMGVYGVAIQADGKIVYAGGGSDFTLVRYEGDTVPQPGNQSPMDLNLSNTTVAENLFKSTIVGTLATVDPDLTDNHSYLLVAGAGAEDNAAFILQGNILKTIQSFDFETKSSYSIRVRTNDGRGGTFEKPMTITIGDRNDAPKLGSVIADQLATPGYAFSLDLPANTFRDQDVDDSLTLSADLVGRTLPDWLTFDAATATFRGTPDSSNVGQLTIRVSATDRAGATISQEFFLTIGTVGTAPAPIDFSSGTFGLNRVGTNKNETLKGGNNKDILQGLGGSDTLYGYAGNDQLFGQDGNDRLYGGDGRDLVTGGNGSDRLWGEAGDDVLLGGAGSDTLSGGSGKDLFGFESLSDAGDLITDFSTTADLIDLRSIFVAPNFGNSNPFAQFTQFVRLVKVGSDTQVKIDADGSGIGTTFVNLVTLQDVSASVVDSRHFILV